MNAKPKPTFERIAFGIAGFDHVLSPRTLWKDNHRAAGAVVGSLIGLFGVPGIGRTKLMLQAACNLAAAGTAVYYHSYNESYQDLIDMVRTQFGLGKKGQSRMTVSDSDVAADDPDPSIDSVENLLRHQLIGDVVFLDGVDVLVKKEADWKRLAIALQNGNAGARTVLFSCSTPASKRVPASIVHKLDVALELARVEDLADLVKLSTVSDKNRYGDHHVKALFLRRTDGRFEPLGVVR